MALIKQYHKDTDTTYVYSSESYWDPEKKQSRSKRTVVGKIDPKTGEMVPTGKRGRKKKADPESTGADAGTDSRQFRELYEKTKRTATAREQEILGLKSDIKALREEISVLRTQNRKLKNAIEKINSISGGMLL